MAASDKATLAQRIAELEAQVDDLLARRTSDLARNPTAEVMRNLPMMVAAVDADGLITFWNSACERCTGYAAAEIVGQPHALTLLCPDPAARRRMLRVWRRGAASGAAWTWPLVTREGQQRFINWTLGPTERPWADWTAWALGIDVTPQQQAEFCLREALATESHAHARLVDAVESLPFSFAVYDQDDRLVLANSRTKEQFPAHVPLLVPGTPYREIVRRSAEAGMAKLEPGQVEAWIEQVSREHQVEQRTFEAESEDGRWFRVHHRRTSEGGTVSIRVDITQRKRAEQALRESEARLQAAQEIAHVGDWERNLVTGRLHWSPETYRIFGLPPPDDDSEPGNFLDHVHPDDRAQAEDAIRNAQERQAPLHFEHRLIRPDGAIRSVREMGQLRRDAGGRPTHMVGTVLDITDRKRAEDELRQSAERLARAQQVAHIGSWDYTIADGTVRWSDETYRIVGLEPTGEPVPMVRFLEMVHPDDRHFFEKAQAEAYRIAPRFDFVYRLFHRDGSLLTLHQQGEVEFDAAGRPVRVYGAAQDITAAQENQRRLQESQQRLTTILNTIPHAVTLKDRASRILLANPAAAELLGSTPEALVGQLAYLAPPQETADLLAEEQALLSGATARIDVERRFTSRSGEMRYAHLIKEPVRDEQGQVQGLVAIALDITERKAAEQELLLSEQRLAKAQQIAHLGSWNWDFAAETLNWSDETYRIYGLTREAHEINYGAFIARVHPDDRPRVRDNLIAALKAQHTYESEHRIVRPDGCERSVLEQFETLRDEQGHPLQMIGVTLDTTERKRAEEELRRSEEKFRNLIEGSLQGIAIQTDERIVFINQAMCTMHGYDAPAQLIGENSLHALVAPEDRERLRGYQLARLRGEAAPGHYEVQALRRDGSRFTAEVITRLVNWESAQAMQVVSLDVTERKQAEQAMALLVGAVEQTGDAMFITDTTGAIEYVNPAFERITGYSREEVQGARPSILKSGRQSDEFHANVWTTLARGELWQGRYTNRRKDGSLYDTDSTHSPIRGKDGRITHFVSVQRDITAQVLLEEQLRRSQRMETIGTLAGGIAHDFNNILMPIIGFTEIVREEFAEDSTGYGDLSRVLAGAHRAKELVSQILLFSRYREGHREVIQLPPIVTEVTKLLRSTLPRTIAIEQRVAPDLHSISADSTQIYQVLMNLCVNAGHAMPDGGVLTVALENVMLHDFETYLGHKLSGPQVRLSVIDTGIGMDEETQSHIFEPFFTTKDVDQGTGLGLSTSFGIIQAHDGSLYVESAPGKGSTFQVFFKAVERGNVSPAPQHSAVTGGNESILFVDDEVSVVELGVKVLRHLGYRVTGCTSGSAALEVFRNAPEQFDLLFVDQTMPGITGRRVVEEVRRTRPDLPVVICTGNRDILGGGKFSDLAVNEVLFKPVGAEEMSRAVRRVLDQQRRHAP